MPVECAVQNPEIQLAAWSKGYLCREQGDNPGGKQKSEKSQC